MMTLPRRFELDARLRAKSMALVAAVLLLAGCTSRSGLPGHIDSPEAAAHQLADGIAKMDLSPVPFAGATGAQINQQLSPLVSGMGPRKPAVAVGPVVAEKTAATVTLHLSWVFPGVQQPWSYDSSAHLVRDSGQWKVQWQPSIVEPSLDGANRLTQRRLQPTRGEVLGQAGEAIVKSRPVVRIGIDKSQVSATAATVSAGRLAKLVGIDPKAYAGKVAAAGPAAFVEAIVLRATAKDRPLNKSVFAIPGALPIEGEQSLAPSREFARALLGTVGEASKEIVDSSNGTVVAGDEVGLSGLQRRYDGQLRGTPGVLVQVVAAKPSSTTGPAPTASPSPSSNPTASPSPSSPPAASPSPSLQPTASPSPSLQTTASPSPSSNQTPRPARTVFEVKPIAGKDLSTTLSLPLQNLAERTLGKTKPASALVAIRPSTGEILAAANGPGSHDQSIATFGEYPPGSTFKVISSLALLRVGLKPSSPVTCPLTVTVNGKKFKNYSDYPSNHLGKIDLRTALAQSCNTAFIGQRGKVTGADLADAAGSLGVGVDYNVGFPSFFGSVPIDNTATGHAASMIGQAKVQASPMAMASVAASVSAGRTVIPHLIVGHQATPKAKPLAAAEASQLRTMMAGVVSMGSGRILQQVKGPRIIAKTGTAEFGTKPPLKTHAWMIAAQGDLAVAAFVAEGSTGSHTAGPLLATFLNGAR